MTELAAHARGLRKRYGPVQAVDGLDLDIPQGQVIALLGPNGAGKSTSVDMLLGLTAPDEGTVSLLGMAPQKATASGLVGALLQVGGLPPDLSIGETLRFLASLYPKPMTVDHALELAGIADIRDQRVNRLSGGQIQRVRFALAIIPDPQFLVLDEPTVAMDASARHAFWSTMRGWTSQGRTVLFATHYLQEADDFADRVVLLQRGKVIVDGSPGEVKARTGLRTVRCVLPHADRAALLTLPGVRDAEVRGQQVVLRCTDSDATLRALIAEHPDASTFEVTGAALEDAFLDLTADHSTDDNSLEASR